MSSSSVNIRDIGTVWNNAFRRIFNCCRNESVKPLQYFCESLPLSYLIDERRLMFFRKLLVHDNVVIRTLVALPAVIYEYIGLCSKYDIKDPLSSRTHIKSHLFKAFCASVF